MKKIIPALLLFILASCTKQSLTKPQTTDPQSIAANTVVSYKDNSISVINFKAQPDNEGIKVAFTTLYEKNIVRLEILKGVTSGNLCSIYKQSVNANSYSATEYSTSDTNENKSQALYYMVKYTLVNGDWGYTPVFKLSF